MLNSTKYKIVELDLEAVSSSQCKLDLTKQPDITTDVLEIDNFADNEITMLDKIYEKSAESDDWSKLPYL